MRRLWAGWVSFHSANTLAACRAALGGNRKFRFPLSTNCSPRMQTLEATSYSGLVAQWVSVWIFSTRFASTCIAKSISNLVCSDPWLHNLRSVIDSVGGLISQAELKSYLTMTNDVNRSIGSEDTEASLEPHYIITYIWHTIRYELSGLRCSITSSSAPLLWYQTCLIVDCWYFRLEPDTGDGAQWGTMGVISCLLTHSTSTRWTNHSYSRPCNQGNQLY